ncbi:MAG: diguanylate cyclase [Rhodocyclaceae bacterium]|nr:diguanylate cyclase [Rhodocyclaceae bacterium]MBX3668223.1 diguanylate cyclase [Rhodocyclaceae bacterium]
MRISRISLLQTRYAVICALLLGVLSSCVQIAYDFIEEDETERNLGAQLLQSLAAPAAQAAYHLNQEAARGVVNSLVETPGVVQAQITSDFGEVLAERHRSAARSALAAWIAPHMRAEAPYATDLLASNFGKRVGVLQLHLDRAEIYARILRRAALTLALGVARNLALAIMLLFVFHRVLTRPLEAMIDRIENAGTGGNDDVVAQEIERKDEVGELARAFQNYRVQIADHLEQLDTAQASLRAGERRYRDIVETAEEGVWVIDEHNVTRLVNAKFAQMLRYSADSMLGRPIFDFMDEEGREIALHNVERRRAGVREQHEFKLYRSDGSALWVEMATGPIVDESGAYRGAVAMVTDITERRRARKELSEANEQLSRTVQELQARERETRLVARLSDLMQSCESPAEAFRVIENCAAELFAPVAGSLAVRTSDAGMLATVARWHDSLSAPAVFTESECWAVRRGQTHYSEGVRGVGAVCAHCRESSETGGMCIPLMVQGELLGVVTLQNGVMSVTSVERAAELFSETIKLGLWNLRLRVLLREQATRDALTGLFNRRYLDDALPRELHRCLRSGEQLAVAMLDIDHFKRFNDTYGHEAGDSVLKAVAGVVQDSLRKSDIACRYGGEEIACVLPDSAIEDAHERFEAIRRDIAALRLSSGGRLLEPITVSVGLAQCPAHGRDRDSLMRAADSALYRAKESGRDRICLFGEYTPHAHAANG